MNECEEDDFLKMKMFVDDFLMPPQNLMPRVTFGRLLEAAVK